jgi:hypothetical protein
MMTVKEMFGMVKGNFSSSPQGKGKVKARSEKSRENLRHYI